LTIPSFTVFFFIFLLLLTTFFSILLYGFPKKCTIFVWFYCMDLRFYQKILQNYGFFFLKKKLRYLKSKISTKFHCLLFCFIFLAFLAFFFSISPIQTCPKIMKFFVVFYWKG